MHAATGSARTSQNAPTRSMTPSPSPWRVLIVDHRAAVRQMLRAILDSYAEIIEVVGEVSDSQEAVLRATLTRPDLVLMDVTKDGVTATREIKQALPDTVVVGISQEYNSKNYNAMIAAGAVAFVHKDEAAHLLFRTVVYAMTTYCPLQLQDSHPS